MKVAFLFDPGNADGTLGGAELTMREFMVAAPGGVEVGLDADGLEGADAVVVGNCTSYAADTVQALRGKKVVRYHNDLARHEHADLREWLDGHATHVFCSPLHRDRYGLDGRLIPPAVNLKNFRPTRQMRRNGSRSGNVAVGTWQNPGKGQQLLKEWADEHGTVDVYGEGPFVPRGENLDAKGPLEPGQVAQTLWGYERFVHVPTSVEPFGRAVVEAWAAGCSLVVNGLVGALWWLRERPEGLDTAAEDFWDAVMS